MPWIPENQRGTDYYIFNQKFRCSVKHIDMRSSEHIKHFGMPTCGIKEYDTQVAHERVDTYLTIAQMVQYFEKGSVVGVKDIKDTKIIYERITDHLNAWKHQLQFGLNNGAAPIKDLMALDQFANTVYAHAQYQFTQDIVDSLLLQQMGGMMPFNKDNLIADMKANKARKEKRDENTNARDIINEEEEIKPQRQELGDFFSTFQPRSTNLNRWGDK